MKNVYTVLETVTAPVLQIVKNVLRMEDAYDVEMNTTTT